MGYIPNVYVFCFVFVEKDNNECGKAQFTRGRVQARGYVICAAMIIVFFLKKKKASFMDRAIPSCFITWNAGKYKISGIYLIFWTFFFVEWGHHVILGVQRDDNIVECFYGTTVSDICNPAMYCRLFGASVRGENEIKPVFFHAGYCCMYVRYVLRTWSCCIPGTFQVCTRYDLRRATVRTSLPCVR